MSVHAHRPSAMLRLGVRLSCLAGGILGIGLAVILLFTVGVDPALFALLVGTPILVGLAGAVATLVVSPMRVRELQQQIEDEQAAVREMLGHEVLITNGTARYYHPVPQPDVPMGGGEVTAYSSGYLGFEDTMRVTYRTLQLKGWRQVGQDEILLSCLPLYDISVRTKHAPEWRAWLAEFHGPEAAPTVIDLVAAEMPPDPPMPDVPPVSAQPQTVES
jgi:hypothetical protein